MNNIRDFLENKDYWETVYNRMVLKQGMSPEDKNLLWKLKEVYKKSIIDEVMSGTYQWSVPQKLEIAKHESNKKRVVYMYNTKDRFVLGIMYRAISDYYKDKISNNCFSYKKDTNTSDAIKYIRDNKTEDFKFGVKVDIHAYFNSVSVERVTELINELFSDGLKVTVEKLMLDNKVTWKGKEIEEWKSLVPGCAFGSFFANMCLKPCDDYFDNKDCIYARYSDDIIVLSKTKEELIDYIEIIKKYISEYDLTINESKYTWFEPGDDVEYLGLKLMGDGNIDISDHAKFKIKKQIHRWCRKGRMEIERDHEPFEKVARKIIRKLNNKNFKCYINNKASYGWCHYSFRYITTIQSLIEIDFYTRDTLRAMKTGKHNKNNVKALNDEDFKALGWVSLVDLYKLYREDFDYYCEIIELL
jgi:hypothetical protein